MTFRWLRYPCWFAGEPGAHWGAALGHKAQKRTVDGLTDLHEILMAIIRAALTDQALASGLEGRIAEMQARRDRLQDRAVKRRQIAKDVMVDLDLKKLTAPDFTASIRPGNPALMVIDEAAVPSIYWEPREPRLNRQGLTNDLKQGAARDGGALLQVSGRSLLR
jgi:Siphovirus Gp157